MSNAENLARLGLALTAHPTAPVVLGVTSDEADVSQALATNEFVKRVAVFPGVLIDYAGLKLPSGYLWCDGSAVSRTTYATLFAAITAAFLGTTSSGSTTISSVNVDLTTVAKAGMPLSGPGISAGTKVASVTASTIVMTAQATANGSAVAFTLAPWGVGDGSTTFNVPDSRGRVCAGGDAMGGTVSGRMTAAGGVSGVAVGSAGGVETHTLTSAQLPSHNHPVFLNDPGHAHSTSAIYFTGGNNISGGSTANLNIQALSSSSVATGITVRDTTGGG